MTRTDASQKSAALVIAVLSAFITPFMGSAINVTLPAMGREFKADAVLIGWVVTSYLLSSAVTLVPFGRVADIFGRKKIFMTGMGIYSFGALLSTLSASVVQLILCQVLMGFGSALIFATSMAILISVYPPMERGKVLGIAVSSVYIGLSVGPFLGGLLTEYFSWRGVFLANVPLGLIVISLVAYRLKGEWAEAKGEPFDLVGAVIYAIAIISLMYGMSSTRRACRPTRATFAPW